MSRASLPTSALASRERLRTAISKIRAAKNPYLRRVYASIADIDCSLGTDMPAVIGRTHYNSRRSKLKPLAPT